MEIRDLADELQAILDGERPRLSKAEMREYMECLRASRKPTPNPDKTKVGVFNKFIVSRVDGTDCKGGKHEDCDYFVLDVDHDPLAKAALAAYADAAQATLPILACDMRERYGLRAPTVDTVSSIRAELVAKIGDCCMGGDPLCSGGCLAEKASLRNYERERASSAEPRYIEEIAEALGDPTLISLSQVATGIRDLKAERARVPAGWKIQVDGNRVRVTKPGGAVTEWHHRPATNGSGMYDLCQALATPPEDEDAAWSPTISERTAFETWLEGTTGWKRCAERGQPFSLRQTVNGDYCDYRVNGRWYAWKARARLDQSVQTAETVRPWPKFVQDECLEVLRNMDTELSARGRKSARIERLINAIAGMSAHG